MGRDTRLNVARGFWPSFLLTFAPKRLLGGSVWSLADQVLISASNFGTMVLLARSLGPADFGTFTLAYLFLLLANALQTALITYPHNVLGAPLEGAAYRDYTASAAVGQFEVAGGFTLLALAGAAVAEGAGWTFTSLLLALAVAMPAWQLQDFARRVLYTKGRVQPAFLNDIISYGGQFIGVLLLMRARLLTAPSALFMIGATSAIAALAGFWAIRSDLRGQVGPSAFRANWALGKWLAAASLTNWLASQMYPVLTAGLIGVYATGVLRALQNLMAPTQILANAYQMIASPQASIEHARGGRSAVTLFLVRGAVILAVPLLAYFLLVGAFARRLITLFYSSAYAVEARLIWPLGLAYLLSYAARVLTIGLAATRDTRPLFYAQATAAVVTCSLGVVLVRLWGLYGAAVGAAATQSALVLALAYFLYRAGRGDPIASRREEAAPATSASLMGS